ISESPQASHLRANTGGRYHSLPGGRPSRLAISSSRLSSTDFDLPVLSSGRGGPPFGAVAGDSVGENSAVSGGWPGAPGRRNAASRRCAMLASAASALGGAGRSASGSPAGTSGGSLARGESVGGRPGRGSPERASASVARVSASSGGRGRGSASGRGKEGRGGRSRDNSGCWRGEGSGAHSPAGG